jgi:hypothetical protein
LYSELEKHNDPKSKMQSYIYHWNDHSYIFWLICRVYIATIIGFLPVTIFLVLIWSHLVHHSSVSPTCNIAPITTTTLTISDNSLTSIVLFETATTFLYSLAGCAVYIIILSEFWNVSNDLYEQYVINNIRQFVNER